AELLLPLSLATDIGMGAPMESGLQACLLAVHLGEAVGLSEAELNDLFYLVLLWFAGCTADSHIAAALFGDEIAFRTHIAGHDSSSPSEALRLLMGFIAADRPWLQRAPILVSALGMLARESNELYVGHCEVARSLAKRLGVTPKVQAGLGQVFERWDGKAMPGRLKHDQLMLIVRVAYLALQAALVHRMSGVEGAIAMARQRSGGAFDPKLVECFCRIAPQLCKVLEATSIWDAVLDSEPRPHIRLSARALEDGTRAIADFVDLKSPYLA